MISYRFKNTYLVSTATNFPEKEVTSAALEESIAPLYQRLQVPQGTLERLSGISSRYFWEPEVMPSVVATVAAEKALAKVPALKKEIGALFSCSVTRDYFEPATATLIHRNLGLSEVGMAFDISNACIGFSNGLLTMAHLIETGVVQAGIVVSGENVSRLVQNNIALMNKSTDLTRERMIQLLPTLTLGCASVAYVLCHKSLLDKIDVPAHRFVGGALRSATQYNDLCAGNADHCVGDTQAAAAMMLTESSKIIAAAAELGSRLLPEVSETLQWQPKEVDRIFCHQVGKQVNEAFYKTIGLEYEKEFTIYKKYGNLVSAAMPSALSIGAEQLNMQKGEKVLCTSFGSGLNAIFLGFEW